MSAAAPRIVSSPGAAPRVLPTPGRLAVRLALSSLAATSAHAAIIGVTAALAFEGPALERVCRLAAVHVGVWGVACLALVLWLPHRCAPIYRSSGRVGPDGTPVPPSKAALADAYRLPRAVHAATGLALVAMLLVWLAQQDRIVPWPRLLAFAWVSAVSGATCAHLAQTASTDVLHAWRSAVPVAFVDLSRRPRLAASAGGVAWSAASLPPAAMLSVAGSPSLEMTCLALLVPALAAWWVRRRAAALAHDLGCCAAAAAEPVAPAWPSATLAAHAMAGMRTQEGVQIAAALQRLATRFSALAERERQAREAVESAQRLKASFVASMSHDLRSPLSSIIGFAELMALGADGPLSATQSESVQAIRRSAQDLLHLLDDILDWARLQAGRLTLRMAWTPSVEILTQAVSRGQALVQGRDLEIVAELEPGLPPLYVDRARIIQAVVGLLRHAARAMDGGRIHLIARVEQGPPGPARQVRVEVVDAGAGIRDADRAKIFEAFREIVEPSGRRIGGLGLGLALARGLVQAHGGDAWCTSEPGRGTRLSVAVPLEA